MGLDLKRVGTRVLGLVLVLALVGAGFFAWVYTRPLVRPDELEHFESVAARALQDVNAQRCSRPSIGASSEEDGTARFASLLDIEGPFRACHAHLARAHEAISDALECSAEVSQAQAQGVAAEALAACPGLVEEARAIAASASVCSPRAIGDERDLVAHLRMTQALLLHARSLVQQGDPRAGLTLTLATLQLSLDFGRGRAPIVIGWLGHAAVWRAVRELDRILTDAPLDEATLVEAARDLALIVEHIPQPDTWMRDDGIHAGLHQLDARGWQGPRPLHLDPDPIDDEALFDAMGMTHALEHVRCVSSETAESCLRRFVNGEMVSSENAFLWPAWAGRRAAKEASEHAAREALVDHLTTYWHGALMEEARMRALLGVVAARLHRLRTGTCPDAQTELSGDAMHAGFGGTFAIRVREGALEIDAPEWLDELAPEALDPDELTLAYVPCAAAP